MKRTLICLAIIVIAAGVFAEQPANPFILKIFPRKIAYQGNSVVITAITLANIKPNSLIIKAFNKSYILYPYQANKYRLPLGIKMNQKPGKYRIALYYKNKKRAAFFMTVKKKPFKMTSIYMTEEMKNLVTSKALIYESNLIGRLFKKVRSAFYQGKYSFKRPAYGRLTSVFGVGRNYKDQKGKIVDTWRHKGLDFSGRVKNKKVLAANSGKVIFAKLLKAHGGTIMIDHGQGIITIYSHVGDIKVKAGEMAKRGQYIASIGNSGISTGPHLHFGLSVANVRVNPLQWIKYNLMQ